MNPITGGIAPPPIYSAPVPQILLDWTRALQTAIADLSRTVLVDGQWIAVLPAFLLAVLFGIVHIAGPGHGKLFAISYFSSRESRVRDGLAYSAVVNLVDSLSAVAVVGLGYLLLRAVFPALRTQAPKILAIISYSLVIGFGLWHLLSHLVGSHGRSDAHDHTNAHGDDGTHDHSGTHTQPVAEPVGTPPKATVTAHQRSAPPWALALSVGLVPCPVSTVLLVYGVVNDAFALMLLMVLGVSIGGFLTMTGISLTVILGRRGLLAAGERRPVRFLLQALDYGASLAIILIGGLFLFSTVGGI